MKKRKSSGSSKKHEKVMALKTHDYSSKSCKKGSKTSKEKGQKG